MIQITRMPLNLFRDVLKQVQHFLTVRLFPSPSFKLVQVSNDWLSSSVRVLALLSIEKHLIKFYLSDII